LGVIKENGKIRSEAYKCFDEFAVDIGKTGRKRGAASEACSSAGQRGGYRLRKETKILGERHGARQKVGEEGEIPQTASKEVAGWGETAEEDVSETAEAGRKPGHACKLSQKLPFAQESQRRGEGSARNAR